MSPEQAISGKVDALSDLYSLGVVLYECITGDLPFKGETPISTITKIINDKVEPISKIVPNTPRWLGSIVNKILAKNKNNRFKSGKEFSKALRAKQEQADNFDLNETIKVTTKEFEGIKKKFHPTKKQKTLFFSTIPILFCIGFLLYNNYFPFSNVNNEESLNELDRKKIDLLIYEGDHFFGRGNFYKPSGSNAVEKYLEVLKIQTDNEHAKKQLDIIETQLEKDINKLNASNKIEETKKLILLAQQYFPSNNLYPDKLNQIKIKELELKAANFLDKDLLEAYKICKEIEALDSDNAYVTTTITEIKNNLTKKADLELERGSFKSALNNYNQIKTMFGTDSNIEAKIVQCNSKIKETNTVKIPNLVGLSIEEAKTKLSKIGLLTIVTEIISQAKNSGKVMQQNPKADTETKKGTKVILSVGK